MPQYILGVDEGTTSARAFVMDEDTNVLGFGQAELTQLYPRPGWLEHDPMQILNTQLEVMRAALRTAGIRPEQLSAVGLTNQRESALVWDKATGRPIYNLIVWASRHSDEIVAQWVASGFGDLIMERTGLVPDAFYAASKIRWILDAVPGAQERAERGELLAGTVDSWLIWNLTGRTSFCTEPSNASQTMMMNLATCEWDDDLLAHMRIPRSMLPEIVASDAEFGSIDATFGAAVPITAVLGDQQAGLFGQAALHPGQVKMTYGTAGVLNINNGPNAFRPQGLTPSAAWNIGGQLCYETEGVVYAMGKTMQWLRDDLQLIHAAPDSEWYAGQVSSTEGVYLVPAFTGLAAPTWDPSARAVLVGMSNATNRLHVIRAAVESMVFQTRDLVDAAVLGSGFDIPELRVDGGAVKNDLLCQLQADILGVPVARPQNSEATIFGAMLLAGLSAGVYGSLDEVEAKWVVDRMFEPQISRDQADSMYAGWTAARQLTRGWTNQVA
ncbi:FGGY family carbohydrate kinase [Mycolicibacterium komossense]|uniref:ATP:glycerol 3-phosphotransferase n=1 Tax=Mycolicibacterium komossense TaxID=1779 RepID=A0ABT3C6M4_9MYCO|nr:glycerol kinase GlpK [Mycolicibacterium komossense]MCV7225117.1 glycerol kinase GlpK [Mycolicibacterium komossense]